VYGVEYNAKFVLLFWLCHKFFIAIAPSYRLGFATYLPCIIPAYPTIFYQNPTIKVFYRYYKMSFSLLQKYIPRLGTNIPSLGTNISSLGTNIPRLGI